MSFWQGLLELTEAFISDSKSWAQEQREKYERDLERYKKYYSSYDSKQLIQMYKTSTGAQKRACYDILIERGYTPSSHKE